MNGEIWILDASALVKLIKTEAESDELRRWASQRNLVSSALLRTEARRAVADEGPDVRHRCERLLADTDLVQLTSAMLDAAGRIPGRDLRTLDAIYLACALQIGDDLGGLVSYDVRQLAAADTASIATVSPGASSSD